MEDDETEGYAKGGYVKKELFGHPFGLSPSNHDYLTAVMDDMALKSLMAEPPQLTLSDEQIKDLLKDAAKPATVLGVDIASSKHIGGQAVDFVVSDEMVSSQITASNHPAPKLTDEFVKQLVEKLGEYIVLKKKPAKTGSMEEPPKVVLCGKCGEEMAESCGEYLCDCGYCVKGDDLVPKETSGGQYMLAPANILSAQDKVASANAVAECSACGSHKVVVNDGYHECTECCNSWDEKCMVASDEVWPKPTYSNDHGHVLGWTCSDNSFWVSEELALKHEMGLKHPQPAAYSASYKVMKEFAWKGWSYNIGCTFTHEHAEKQKMELGNWLNTGVIAKCPPYEPPVKSIALTGKTYVVIEPVYGFLHDGLNPNEEPYDVGEILYPDFSNPKSAQWFVEGVNTGKLVDITRLKCKTCGGQDWKWSDEGNAMFCGQHLKKCSNLSGQHTLDDLKKMAQWEKAKADAPTHKSYEGKPLSEMPSLPGPFTTLADIPIGQHEISKDVDTLEKHSIGGPTTLVSAKEQWVFKATLQYDENLPMLHEAMMEQWKLKLSGPMADAIVRITEIAVDPPSFAPLVHVKGIVLGVMFKSDSHYVGAVETPEQFHHVAWVVRDGSQGGPNVEVGGDEKDQPEWDKLLDCLQASTGKRFVWVAWFKTLGSTNEKPRQFKVWGSPSHAAAAVKARFGL